jgi:chromosome segregation protein
VVTHRKGTMEEADVLYGVTMQESGISNIVSVKLEESKELVKSS